MTEEVLQKIKSHGYWFVVIRPLRFEKERIKSLDECRALVRENAISLRGWNYPHYSEEIRNGIDYIECATDRQEKKELWRMYQSGQFAHLFACNEDWWRESSWVPEHFKRYDPDTILDFVSTLYRITEIYEFASRLAAKNLFRDGLKLTIELRNMKNRQMITTDPARHLGEGYICTPKALPKTKTISNEEILGKADELALDHVVWVLERFGWYTPSREVLKDIQSGLLERRL